MTGIMLNNRNGKVRTFSQSGLHPAGNSLCDQESGIDFVLEHKFRRHLWKEEEEEHHRHGRASSKGKTR